MYNFLYRKKNFFRIICILITIYGLSGIYLSEELWEVKNSGFLGDYRYLTNIAAVLTIVVLLIPVLNIHILSTFHLISLPAIYAIEFLVTVVYWFLKIYDERLINAPVRLKKENRVGFFNDLTLHGIPFIFLLYELFNFNCKSNKQSYLFVCGFSIFYYCILKLSKYHEKEYPYGFLNLMSEITFTIFIVGLTGIFLLLMNFSLRLVNFIKKRFN